jgi:hypothetical protein
LERHGYYLDHDRKKINGKMKILSTAQVRAARALLRWTALDLSKRAKIGVATVRRAEVIDGDLTVSDAIAESIRRAFEHAGIEFIDANGGGEGVRLRKSTTAKKRR